MTGMRGNGPGKRADKIVRKVLADGTVKEYRYARTRLSRRRVPAEHGAIRAMAELYTRSPEFTRLSKPWQATRRYYLGILEDRLGWMTVADLESREARADFYELRDAYAERPYTADKLMDSLKALTAWAYKRNRLEVNQALAIEHLAPRGGTRADIVWTEDHQAIVMAAFPRALREAFLFALYTGIRQADMCGLRWEQYRNGWLSFKPSKTRGSTAIKIHLPIFALPPLKALVDDLSRGTEYILTGGNGLPWATPTLRALWRAAKAKSDLKDEPLRWHDIRGTTLTRLAEAGCTDSERAAVSGHSFGGGSKLGDYTARSKQLAFNAYAKWARHMAEEPKVVRLETVVDNRGN